MADEVKMKRNSTMDVTVKVIITIESNKSKRP